MPPKKKSSVFSYAALSFFLLMPVAGLLISVITVVYGLIKKERIMTILGLVGLVIGSIVAYSIFIKNKTFSPSQKDNTTFAALELKINKGVINQYYQVHGVLPTSLNDLPQEKGKEPFTFDPWGNDYIYKANQDGKTYILKSAGPDGVPNTADDISSQP